MLVNVVHVCNVSSLSLSLPIVHIVPVLTSNKRSLLDIMFSNSICVRQNRMECCRLVLQLEETCSYYPLRNEIEKKIYDELMFLFPSCFSAVRNQR